MFIKKMAYASYVSTMMVIVSNSLLFVGIIQGKNLLVTGKINTLIKNNPAVAKLVTGTARVITNPNQLSKICKGDIIVVSMTEVSWEPVLSSVAAIITDEGDDNCHAILFGKKMGIPVIVGTQNGTEVIVDGQIITIDATQGFVCDAHDINDAGSTQRNAAIVIHSSSANDCPSKRRESYGDIEAIDELSYQQGKKQKNKVLHSAEQLYGQYYHGFKDYVLDMQSELRWGRRTGMVEWGARNMRGYNEFTISCIPLSYPFFERNEKTIVRILQLIGDKKYIGLVDKLIERCKEKPSNMKAMDWVSQVAHEEHVKNITLPSHVIREQLMADPKKYQKYVDEGKVPAEERDALIATGLFVRYLIEKGLI